MGKEENARRGREFDRLVVGVCELCGWSALGNAVVRRRGLRRYKWWAGFGVDDGLPILNSHTRQYWRLISKSVFRGRLPK
jgi:hypothetical protein